MQLEVSPPDRVRVIGALTGAAQETLLEMVKTTEVLLDLTGQGYKGGPNTGVFLQITCDDPLDLPVPGQSYTFGVVKAAQAPEYRFGGGRS